MGPGVAARTTVGELLEQWFAVASVNWSPTTVRQTRSVLNGQLHPHLGVGSVADLTTADIDHLYTRLLSSGGVKGQPLKTGTVQRVHVVLRSALAQAMWWGWIWDNPAERAHRIVVVPREPDPPSPHELGVLLVYLQATDPALYTFVIVGAMTGARRAHSSGCVGAMSTSPAARSRSATAGSRDRTGPNSPTRNRSGDTPSNSTKPPSMPSVRARTLAE